jgi:predicted dehydrogenase
MKNGKFGVLVIGAGWVSTQHIAAYIKNPHAEVLAVCDLNTEVARQRMKEVGLADVAIYDNLDEALKHPGVDAVSICTPQHVHCRCVLATAKAGKHMLIEKPAGISLEEIRLEREAIRAAGVKTLVGFVLRWNPLFQTLKSMMADDLVGRPYYVETDYLNYTGGWWAGWPEGRTLEKGICPALLGGCHAIDAMRWFAAKGEFETATPVEVYALRGGFRKGQTREYNPVLNTWIEDGLPMEFDGLEVMLVKFSNGAIGKATSNAECAMPYRFPIRIFGERGTIFDNRLWSHKFPGQTDWVELPSILPGSSNVAHHPFQGEIDHFIDCLREGRESHCNFEDSVKTHEIIFAATESVAKNQPIRLPLLGE